MFGLYIHVPFCVSKCNYCDFNSFKLNKVKKDTYLEDLRKDTTKLKEQAREIVKTIESEEI